MATRRRLGLWLGSELRYLLAHTALPISRRSDLLTRPTKLAPYLADNLYSFPFVIYVTSGAATKGAATKGAATNEVYT
jgi:hypothetical protein